jgi:hypothetical protein
MLADSTAPPPKKARKATYELDDETDVCLVLPTRAFPVLAQQQTRIGLEEKLSDNILTFCRRENFGYLGLGDFYMKYH